MALRPSNDEPVFGPFSPRCAHLSCAATFVSHCAAAHSAVSTAPAELGQYGTPAASGWPGETALPLNRRLPSGQRVARWPGETAPTISSRSRCGGICASVCRMPMCLNSWPSAGSMSTHQPFSTGCSSSPRCIRKRHGPTVGASAGAGRPTRRTSVSPVRGATRSGPSMRRARLSTSTSAPHATRPQPRRSLSAPWRVATSAPWRVAT